MRTRPGVTPAVAVALAGARRGRLLLGRSQQLRPVGPDQRAPATVNVSSVDPARRRPGGPGAAGAAHRGRPDQQAAVQGRPGPTSPPGRRCCRPWAPARSTSARRRRPAGLRRRRRRARSPIVGALTGQPGGSRDRRAGQTRRSTASPSSGQADRGRAGQLGRLPPADRAEQGRADHPRRQPRLPPARRRASPRCPRATSTPGTSGRRTSRRPGPGPRPRPGQRDRLRQHRTRSRSPSRAALADPAKAAAIRDYLKLLNQAYVWAATHQAVGRRSGPRPPACRPASCSRRPRTIVRTPVPITPAVVTRRAVGRRRVHRGRADPRPRGLQRLRRTPASTTPLEARS